MWDMHVLVSGAGIAGLTLGLCLNRAGIECTIVEKASSARGAGYMVDFFGSGYDAANSGGTNLGPTNKVLIARVEQDAAALHSENPDVPVPVDLVTTSASGLDPEISITAGARSRHSRALPW